MFKLNKIFTKIFISMFLAILFFSSIFSIYYITSQKKEIIKSLEQEAKSIAQILIYSMSDAIVLDDNSYIVEFNYDFLSHHELLNSIVIEKNNKYFIINKDKWSYETNIDASMKSLEKDNSVYKMMVDPSSKIEVFHYVTPIIISGSSWGHIHLSFSLKQFHKKIENMYYSFFTFFVILLVIIFLISFFIARSFSKPIISLNEVANEISKGNLGLRSFNNNSDEIGHLSKSFNMMISKIESSQKELKDSYEKLEDRVEERTLELNKTNKMLEDKTHELEQLNQVLDKKVKEEVEKRAKQEKLLMHQSRLAAMGEMIGNIAHQWRQPLSMITTAASGMKVEKEFGLSNNESELNKIEVIIKTSNYLSNTIEDFSNFFKPNKHKETFHIEDKLQQSLELVASSLKFHHIIVEEDLDKTIEIKGFPNEYAQAILNILTNSKDVLVQRKIKNPTIFIKLYKDNNYAVLEIEDNAGGIDEKIIDKIFEPYFTTKHKYQGTGIGLYMSKMIVEENMQGKLGVENSKHGALFKIKIPIELQS
ncbi:hypothetical protein CRV08_11185 [Halarcobacter ebronensis]|uniref:histidine kinase n=1 Tax=Halarcobacter ebronensis TaxID=1462615 RepID=A0A4Q0YA19_9BACT|nr:ATP-binding protein [Halarcobacter ebronensis]RXJ67147.1 hypothetical protein CRV08_11185 [Halarcobacter ebronensis]